MNNSQQKTTSSEVQYLRSRQVQEMLGIGSSTLQSLRIRGIIPAYKVSSFWLYKESEVIAAVEGGEKEAADKKTSCNPLKKYKA